MFNSVHVRPTAFWSCWNFCMKRENAKKPFSCVNASICEINNSLIIKILIKQ